MVFCESVLAGSRRLKWVSRWQAVRDEGAEPAEEAETSGWRLVSVRRGYSSSETLDDCDWTTRNCIPEDRAVHNQRCGNLKYYIVIRHICVCSWVSDVSDPDSLFGGLCTLILKVSLDVTRSTAQRMMKILHVRLIGLFCLQRCNSRQSSVEAQPDMFAFSLIQPTFIFSLVGRNRYLDPVLIRHWGRKDGQNAICERHGIATKFTMILFVLGK
jgi:hypothetical protein